MTPAHTDSPLRRSEAGIFREPGVQNQRLLQNDDEEERQARRRTQINSSSADSTDNTASTASTHEQSENLKKCLEIYYENKINSKNVWSMPVIDAFESLLDRHHKSLNNFTVAGSSLELSSKVYGMRVDSVHNDVLRMSAGLNARKFRENQDDDDGVATGGEGNADPNSSANTGAEPATGEKKRKKQRKKAGATVTKNKETLNARLDTVPMQDPVFGKLNTIVGSINASNRLMNNMLNTVDAELRLRTTHKFWQASDIDEECDYTAPLQLSEISETELLPCEQLTKVERFEGLLLRPINSGYVICDTPLTLDEPDQAMQPLDNDNRNADSPMISQYGGLFDNHGDTSMAFDMNAVCEPLPQLDAYAPILAVDEQDFNEYTPEEHDAIRNCRGLRKSAVIIEDMRPIDSTTNLEYSYRPVEKISQFWAGPSHWRFRRTRHRSTMGQSVANSQQQDIEGRRNVNQKRGRANALHSKKRLRVEFAVPIHDTLFIKLDSKYKSRRANFQKKWDQKKFRLPIDLQLRADSLNSYGLAPAFAISDDNSQMIVGDGDVEEIAPTPMEEEHFMAAEDNDIEAAGAEGGDLFNALHDSMLAGNEVPSTGEATVHNMTSTHEQNNAVMEHNNANDTVLEIATDFEGAPRQVTKIIVPFAKRAKVIDMKNLKRTCTHLITQQFKECAINESQLPVHPVKKNENYATGNASFKEMYKRLPNLLPSVMAEGLTTSIALYSVLHLANDFSYRLIPEGTLDDFSIRQVLDN